MKRLKQFGLLTLSLFFVLLIQGSAQTEPPRIYGGGTVSPAQNVDLSYSLPSGGSSRIQIFKIQNPERVVELGGPRDFQQTADLRLSLVRTVPVFRPRNNTYGEVRVGRLPEGLYLAQIGNPRPTSATLILVTRLGLVVKSDTQSLLAYTADLASGQPRAAQVWVVRDKKIAQTARAEGGLAQLRTSFGGEGETFVAARSGEAWAFSSAYWRSWNVRQNRLYLVTDRPVYRPGQTVFFKGTLRSASGLQPVVNREVEVSIQDGEEAEVYGGKFRTDAYGSFSGEFKSKLDSRLGTYSLTAKYDDETHNGIFDIQEYVKPEYRVTVTPDKNVGVQGEQARFVVKGEYLFGGPVSGGKVSYSVIKRPFYRFAYQSSYGFYRNEEWESFYEGSIVGRGEGRLDAKGELVVTVPMRPDAEQDYRLTLEAGVSDEARREISGTGAVTAYRSGVVLDVRTTSYSYQSGDTITAQVRAQDLEGKPVAVPFTLRASRYFWVRGKGEQSEAAQTLQGRTSPDGTATVQLRLRQQGSYELEVSARDAAGRPTRSSDYVWVSDGSYWFWGYQSLEIRPDKPEYKPGETAKFVIQSPISDGWALVNLEGDRLSRPEIVKYQGSTFTYEVPLTRAMYPNGYLSVTVIGNNQYYTDTAGFLVPPTEKFLNVAIGADKESYRPGEEATYSVKVTNANGQPVQTQLTLGLVDEAIYLIRPESNPDIRGFFWDFKDNVVGTETAGGYYFGNVAPAPTMAASAPMTEARFGQPKEGAAKAADGLAEATVRTDFRDLALWLPSVETDAQGQATIKTKLPDNLTQWRMTARAISKADSVGQNTQNITSTLPVIARLSTPRFLVKGDSATLTVIGQNNLPQAQSGELRLEATGLSLASPTAISASLPAGGRVAGNFQAQAQQSGNASLQASALTPAASDALRRGLPINPKGLKQELGWAGEQNSSWAFNLPPNTDMGQTRASLFLNPSLATAVTPALAYLAGYPYGCSEQTMSRFLPSVLAKQAGEFVELPAAVRNNLDDFVAQGFKRLYDFQHEDGGWGFWQNDTSSLYITSYVLTGLLQAQEAGYSIREDAVRQGFRWMLGALNRPDAETYAADAVAYAAYAFAWGGDKYLRDEQSGLQNRVVAVSHRPSAVSFGKARPVAAERVVLTRFAQNKPVNLGYLADYLKRSDLTPYGHALITLAYQRNGNTAEANRALDSLLARLTVRERVAYWDVKTTPWAWNDDRIEATAFGLLALAKLRPQHPSIPRIANWLMLERKGARWVSTKDTAAVVVAALNLAQARGETAADQQVSVSVNGQAQTVTVGRRGAEVRLDNLQIGENRLEVSGASPFFASAGVSYFEERDYLNPEFKGFRVARQYEKLTARFDRTNDRFVYDRSALSGELKVGDLVVVTLTVRPEQGAARFVLLEEPTPAGLAVVENDDSFRIAGVRSRFGDDYYGWNYWFDGREIRDNRLEFYFSYLEGPVTFTYILRAETPGTFTALPTYAWMMYEPEVRGVGTARTLSVKE